MPFGVAISFQVAVFTDFSAKTIFKVSITCAVLSSDNYSIRIGTLWLIMAPLFEFYSSDSGSSSGESNRSVSPVISRFKPEAKNRNSRGRGRGRGRGKRRAENMRSQVENVGNAKNNSAAKKGKKKKMKG